ncbi:hypothetical protein AYI68_g7444, partial [Smittium mucronatum]
MLNPRNFSEFLPIPPISGNRQSSFFTFLFSC